MFILIYDFSILEFQGQKGRSDSYNYKLAHLDVKSSKHALPTFRGNFYTKKCQFGRISCTQSFQRPKLALKTKKLEKLKKFYRIKGFGIYKYFLHLAVMSYAPFLHFLPFKANIGLCNGYLQLLHPNWPFG